MSHQRIRQFLELCPTFGDEQAKRLDELIADDVGNIVFVFCYVEIQNRHDVYNAHLLEKYGARFVEAVAPGGVDLSQPLPETAEGRLLRAIAFHVEHREPMPKIWMAPREDIIAAGHPVED